jgi:hypothetical protein
MIFRACLVSACVTPTNARASQKSGAAFACSHLANAWAQIYTGEPNLAWARQIVGSKPNNAQLLGQRQLFGLAAWGFHPNMPLKPGWLVAYYSTAISILAIFLFYFVG